LNANKPILVDGRFGPADGGAVSVTDFIRKFPGRLYNALFTPMGRKNFLYFLKRQGLKMNRDYRTQGTLIYPLRNGGNFVVHRGNHLSELVFLEGAYEPLETMIASRVIRRGDVVVDCGANVGYFTALFDRLVGTGGQVHAFEPGSGTFAKLQHTKELLKLERSVLHQKAVGCEVGEIDFWSSTSGSDAQQQTVNLSAVRPHLRQERVPVTTLDAVAVGLRADGKRIAFVKCDIEGAEAGMLQGARATLNSEDPPIWLIEHNRPALAAHGASGADLLSFFRDCEVYFVPICWPPSVMASPRADRWNGKADDLPDECNLIVFPKRGIHAERAASLRRSGLIA
jgi:FkbM family methyltransferase